MNEPTNDPTNDPTNNTHRRTMTRMMPTNEGTKEGTTTYVNESFWSEQTEATMCVIDRQTIKKHVLQFKQVK